MSGLQMKYFVLKPRGTDMFAEASRWAMRTYAKNIAPFEPELAANLIDWVNDEIDYAEKEDWK